MTTLKIITDPTQSMFDKPYHVFVNPTNCSGVMGAGLAGQFRTRFPGFYKEWKKYNQHGLLNTNVEVYSIATSKRRPFLTGVLPGTGDPDPDVIVTLPTMVGPGMPGEIDLISAGLAKLRWLLSCERNLSVAVPALGCGIGRLDWDFVKGAILKELHHISLDNLGHTIDLYPPREVQDTVKWAPR